MRSTAAPHPGPLPASQGEGVLLLLLLLLTSCELGPLDVTGLQCADDRPCGEGFLCLDERCIREDQLPDAGEEDAGTDAGVDAGSDAGIDAGPPDAGLPSGVNLLTNPGFEQRTSDGGVVGWRGSTGRLFPVDGGRTGSRSSRLQSTAYQQQPVLIPTSDVEGPELGMLFCASLWVRSDTDAGVEVTLALRDRFFDGGISTSSGTRVRVRTSWLQVKEEFATIGTSTLQFRLTSNSRFDAGDGVYLDDAWLSRADTGGCP